MVTLDVQKSLICEQDLLLGQGTEEQIRNGQRVVANKLRLMKIVDSLDALKRVDPTMYDIAFFKEGNSFYSFDPLSTEAENLPYIIAPYEAQAGRWKKTVIENQFQAPFREENNLVSLELAHEGGLAVTENGSLTIDYTQPRASLASDVYNNTIRFSRGPILVEALDPNAVIDKNDKYRGFKYTLQLASNSGLLINNSQLTFDPHQNRELDETIKKANKNEERLNALKIPPEVAAQSPLTINNNTVSLSFDGSLQNTGNQLGVNLTSGRLKEALDRKANDDAVVKLTGNQDVKGDKHFKNHAYFEGGATVTGDLWVNSGRLRGCLEFNASNLTDQGIITKTHGAVLHIITDAINEETRFPFVEFHKGWNRLRMFTLIEPENGDMVPVGFHFKKSYGNADGPSDMKVIFERGNIEAKSLTLTNPGSTPNSVATIKMVQDMISGVDHNVYARVDQETTFQKDVKISNPGTAPESILTRKSAETLLEGYAQLNKQNRFTASQVIEGNNMIFFPERDGIAGLRFGPDLQSRGFIGFASRDLLKVRGVELNLETFAGPINLDASSFVKIKSSEMILKTNKLILDVNQAIGQPDLEALIVAPIQQGVKTVNTKFFEGDRHLNFDLGGLCELTGVKTPVKPTDAANKQFVEDAIAQGGVGTGSYAELDKENTFTKNLTLADASLTLKKGQNDVLALGLRDATSNDVHIKNLTGAMEIASKGRMVVQAGLNQEGLLRLAGNEVRFDAGSVNLAAESLVWANTTQGVRTFKLTPASGAKPLKFGKDDQTYFNLDLENRSGLTGIKDPVDARDAAPKGYVDNKLANLITLNTDQTISGDKTFSKTLTINKSDLALSLKPTGDAACFIAVFNNQNTRMCYLGLAQGATTDIEFTAEKGDLKLKTTANGKKIYFDSPDLQARSNYTPSQAKSLTPKDYVDNELNKAVKLEGNQTINGNKVFSQSVSTNGAFLGRLHYDAANLDAANSPINATDGAVLHIVTENVNKRTDYPVLELHRGYNRLQILSVIEQEGTTEWLSTGFKFRKSYNGGSSDMKVLFEKGNVEAKSLKLTNPGTTDDSVQTKAQVNAAIQNANNGLVSLATTQTITAEKNYGPAAKFELQTNADGRVGDYVMRLNADNLNKAKTIDFVRVHKGGAKGRMSFIFNSSGSYEGMQIQPDTGYLNLYKTRVLGPDGALMIKPSGNNQRSYLEFKNTADQQVGMLGKINTNNDEMQLEATRDNFWIKVPNNKKFIFQGGTFEVQNGVIDFKMGEVRAYGNVKLGNTLIAGNGANNLRFKTDSGEKTLYLGADANNNNNRWHIDLEGRSKIKHVPTPTDPGDAAPKSYVDGKLGVFLPAGTQPTTSNVPDGAVAFIIR